MNSKILMRGQNKWSGAVGPLLLACVCAGSTQSEEDKALYRAARPPFIELVREGVPQAVLVLLKQCAPEVRYAEDELLGYIRRISSVSLEVASQAPDGPAVILRVDPQSNPAPAGCKSWVGSRGYRLHTKGNKLYVIGSDALSVVHGVYGLLERHFGVRWLWPGELGEIVPKRNTIAVGQLDETSVPDFAVRWVGDGAWALRHDANVNVKIGDQPAGVKWKWKSHTFPMCKVSPRC